MLLNIIHPYTYKLKGNTLHVGPCKEYEERDRSVSDFAKRALDSSSRVIWHQFYNADPISHAMEAAALQSDPFYEFIFDERVDLVVTTPHGAPLPEEKLASISQDVWDSLKNIYTSHSALQWKIQDAKIVMFIGGVLENCVANAVAYFHHYYRNNGQKLFYIPELCVFLDNDLLVKVKKQLHEKEIVPIDIETALHFL